MQRIQNAVGDDILWNVSYLPLPSGKQRVLTHHSISTILALLLDVSTIRTEHRLGAYTKPEDDQHQQHLHDMKTTRVRAEGYEAPEEQIDHISPTWKAPEDDIAYRSSFAGESRRDSHSGDAGYRDH